MFIEYLQSDLRFFLAVVITVIVSITVHELAHGVAAVALGDRTPIESGHMTLNPVVHLGVFSIIMLLLAGIAWGAMPVNPDRLNRRTRFGEALVALAGPVSNVLLAAVAVVAVGVWVRFGDGDPLPTRAENLRYFLGVFAVTNVSLAIFNLIPLPPLDGSRILANLVPAYARVLESLGTSGAYMVVFIVVFANAGRLITPAAVEAVRWGVRTVAG